MQLGPEPHCIKLTINGNSAFNGNYHGNKTRHHNQSASRILWKLPLKSIDGKFYATGPRLN